MNAHYVEVYAEETPGVVVFQSGAFAVETMAPESAVEVVEAETMPAVVEVITAGGQGIQGDPGPAGPPGDNLMAEDPVAWYILAKT